MGIQARAERRYGVRIGEVCGSDQFVGGGTP